MIDPQANITYRTVVARIRRVPLGLNILIPQIGKSVPIHPDDAADRSTPILRVTICQDYQLGSFVGLHSPHSYFQLLFLLK